MVTSSPNQADSPSAVVRAAQTFGGGCAISRVRTMRSGKAISTSSEATGWLRQYCNRPVASTVLRASFRGTQRRHTLRRVTTRSHPGVDAYLDGLPEWQREVCSQLRQLIAVADPEIQE